MTELPFVQIVYRLIEPFQQSQSFRGDARLDDAPVVFLALARDPTVFFHAVEQASHIGVAGNHALSDAAAKNSVWLRAAQDTQDVVLRSGEASGFEETLRLLG